LDFAPRIPTEADVALMTALAAVVMDELELRLAAKRAQANYWAELIRHEQREEHLTALNRELAHRSKNLLALVQAIARQTTASSATIGDYAERLCNRVQALARTHDLIIADDWEGVTLADLLGRQLEPYLDAPERMRMQGPVVALTPAAAQYLGMAFYELAANSLRHGVLGQPSGRLDVQWRVDGPLLLFDWQEQGPSAAVPRPEGFGRVVLERLAPQALEGQAHWTFKPSGVAWHLACPLPTVKAAL
jgi:two-component sensor histidine kinase